MHRFILGVLVGLLLSLALGGSVSPAAAQQVRRMFGTVSGGAAIPIAANSDGAVIVKLN